MQLEELKKKMSRLLDCCTHGSVKWWLVGHPFFPRAGDKQESKVMQGALSPL